MKKVLPFTVSATQTPSPTLNKILRYPSCCKKIRFQELALSVLFSSVIACILSISSLFVSPIIVFAAIATVGICIVSAILLLILRDKLRRDKQEKIIETIPLLPKATPSTPTLQIKKLKDLFKTKLQDILNKKGVADIFQLSDKDKYFPSFDRWQKIFLKDPLFLLKSALNNWQQQKTPEGIILTHPRASFSVLLNKNSLEELYQTQIKSNDYTRTTYCEQLVITDVNSLNIAPGEIFHYEQKTIACDHLVISSNKMLLEHSTSQDQTLYKLFKESFSLYYTALMQNLSSKKLMVLKLIDRGSSHNTVQILEKLAFLCALEQIQYEENGIFSPEDYWQHFVEKNFYTSSIKPRHLVNNSIPSLGLLVLDTSESRPEDLEFIQKYCRE